MKRKNERAETKRKSTRQRAIQQRLATKSLRSTHE
ncbi:hypothetical protein HALLA_04245 (plasmid) [Halostagnicola larsenii XH-48]|uniref:Uncharacterized protein n=1 Tax=Halostagnicola larsenii XH-48 TaxID=797299 RepID=W0JSF4_9EURY|nr:hypothetical protein HALLA_04245 [Halostagnicola larsenii XH-48]